MTPFDVEKELEAFKNEVCETTISTSARLVIERLARKLLTRAILAERERCAEVLESAVLTQVGWEANEDVVCLNGKPIGGTITRHPREFERWWPAVQRKLAAAMEREKR